MSKKLLSLYDRLALGHPRMCLAIVAVGISLLSFSIPNFQLDASGDSLLLESDQNLDYYRSIRARYGSDEFLILTYTPEEDLFSADVLADLQLLRAGIAEISQVSSIVSILDVPLLESPPVSGDELSNGAPRLLSDRTDLELAREELRRSPLYRNRLLSEDGRTTAFQINLKTDPELAELLAERGNLRQKRLDQQLDQAEDARLATISRQIKQLRVTHRDETRQAIDSLRSLKDKHSESAELHMGGLPMISADMIDYIRHDLTVFGIALIVMLVLVLALVFREPRWVILPSLVCLATVASMLGFLGLVDWPVTVVSSNFISLLVILTLSLNVHFAVRYRELRAELPDADQRKLLVEMLRSKFQPAALTSVTTMVAFASLAVSDIRPVIDFGWMMVTGIAAGFSLTLLILPPALQLMNPGAPASPARIVGRFTGAMTIGVKRFPRSIFLGYAIVGGLSAWSLAHISIDNRFIDYFRESTEIYQGMKVIDERLGGTTPMDVVLDAAANADALPDPIEGYAPAGNDAGIATTSYWFNAQRLDTVQQVHDFLARQPEIGKVVSLETSMYVIRQLTGEDEPDNFTLSLVYKRLPENVRETLFEPYLSGDGDQLRFAARTYETRPGLDRNSLLENIRQFLIREVGIADDNVHLTGLFVLYNNVLQSLLKSQILTGAVVLIAVFIMFAVTFRSVWISAIAIVPNVLGAMMVLGFMSRMNIPLDIMTITVAAIAIGIGVDDTIHYVHRFIQEQEHGRDYESAVDRSHDSVGRAMFYTTATIVLGFAVLAFSQFIPTILFGLLTGLAMIIALVADLTLLPLMLSRVRIAST